MKIRKRLYLSAIVPVILVGVFVLLIFIAEANIAKQNEKFRQATEVKTAISELDIVTYEYLLHREKRMEEQWNTK